MASTSDSKQYGTIAPDQEETARLVAMGDADDQSNPLPPPLRSNHHGRHAELPEFKALVAECMGTATLVQIGCGAHCVALLASDATTTLLWPMIATAWALSLTIGIYLAAATSGGHLNPAVTLAFALVRRDDFSIRFVLPYWIAQLVGAFLAGIINLLLFQTVIKDFEESDQLQSNSTDELSKSATAFGDYWSLLGNVQNAFHASVIEAFGTGFLCLIIFATTNPKTSVPPVVVPVFVGVAYGLMVCLLGPLTGGAMNPARDMGPRLVTLIGHWGKKSMTDWFPYFIGPLIGGPVGAFLADHVLLLG